MIRGKILVVGGYGHVGQVICRELGEKFPGKVIAAGRDLEKAKRFASTTNQSVSPMKLDVHTSGDHQQILKDVFLVIMCLDQTDIAFAQSCLASGINYIDITASYSFLSRLRLLDHVAHGSKATAVLSVGLSPGLTNLLMQYSKANLDTINIGNISVLLGLGDAHGAAAIKWMIDNIDNVYHVFQNGVLTRVGSFTDRKETIFPAELGRRNTYRFDFPEQHFLPETLEIPSVSNRICFDSRTMTDGLALLRKLGLFKLVSLTKVKNLIVKACTKITGGSDIFAAKVDVFGTKSGKLMNFECSVVGRKQSLITGKVAAIVAQSLYTASYPGGVYHIEEVFDCLDIISQLSDDLVFYSD